MLTSLSLENFKSWHSVEHMRFGRITGLFGTNSSGKTSLLEFLLLLKQTAESSDRTQVLNFGSETTPTSLDSFRNVIRNHDTSLHLRYELGWDLGDALRVLDPDREDSALFSSDSLSVAVEVSGGKQRRLTVDELIYRFADSDFMMRRKQDKRAGYELSSPTGFQFKRPPGRPWDLPAPVKCYGFPDEVKAYFLNAGFLSDFQLAFEDFFKNVYYLGPLREYPARLYPWSGTTPSDVGKKGEKVIDALLAARLNRHRVSLGAGRKALPLDELVAVWLQKLGLISGFSLHEIEEGGNIYRVNIKVTPESVEVPITDVGFGVSQVLPVLVLCFYVPKGSVLIFEQPEIHLHPSVEA